MFKEDLLSEVGASIGCDAGDRVAWAGGWIGQEFSIMQPVLQNPFRWELISKNLTL